MSLRNTDEIKIDPEAIEYIEIIERLEGIGLAKCEVIEHFFDWLKDQPRVNQAEFLREALSE